MTRQITKQILSVFLVTFVAMFLSLSDSSAQELRRKKNTATRVNVVFVNSSTGAFISGASGMNCKCKLFNDGASPADLTTNCNTSTPTELSSTGVYYLPLTSGETNDDYVQILCTSSSTNAMPYLATINTKYGTVITDSAGALEDLGTTANTDVLTQIASGLNTAVPGSPTADSVNDRVKRLTDSTGTFQTGSTTTVLNLAAGETSNTIVGSLIGIDSGAGARQTCRVSAYNTGTKAATCADTLTTAPASGDKYTLIHDAGTSISPTQVANAVWDEARSGHSTAGTFGQGVASVQGNVTGSVGSVTGAVGSVTAGVTVTTNNDKTNYLLSSANQLAVAGQVWDISRTGHSTAGTFGEGVVIQTNNDKNNYQIAGTKVRLDQLNDVSSSTVYGQCSQANTDYGAATTSLVNSQFTDVKGASWNSTNDTLHGIRTNLSGGGGGSCDEAVIADAVWDELLSGHVLAGSAGKILTNALNTTLTCEAHRQQ